MRLIALVMTVLGGLGVAHARPIIIEESAVITPPAGSDYVGFGYQVGTNGQFALVIGDHPRPSATERDQTFDALLYRRVNNAWVYQRVLAQGSRSSDDYSSFPVIIVAVPDSFAERFFFAFAARRPRVGKQCQFLNFVCRHQLPTACLVEGASQPTHHA